METHDSQGCIRLLKALADETRWRLVQELLSTPLTVNELTERLKVSQYNISKHLRILRESGIVQTSKQGRKVYCQVVPVYRQRLAGSKDQLDLGCCTFRFDRKPK